MNSHYKKLRLKIKLKIFKINKYNKKMKISHCRFRLINKLKTKILVKNNNQKVF